MHLNESHGVFTFGARRLTRLKVARLAPQTTVLGTREHGISLRVVLVMKWVVAHPSVGTDDFPAVADRVRGRITHRCDPVDAN